MAVDNSIQGSNVVMEISDDGITFETLVCEEDSQADVSNEVTTTRTKCSTFKGISAVDVTISGNAVCNADPDSGEVSYSDILGYQKLKTQKYFRYRNAAQGAFTAGQAFELTGVGYFTQTTVTATTAEVVKFSWTFSVTDLDGDISS
jgi:hypothetical protein